MKTKDISEIENCQTFLKEWMKSQIIVKCSCGEKWEEDNTPEAAGRWWELLAIADPRIVEKVEQDGDEKTLEYALRLVWARHSIYQQERGNGRRHTAKVTEETTIESIEELGILKKLKTDS